MKEIIDVYNEEKYDYNGIVFFRTNSYYSVLMEDAKLLNKRLNMELKKKQYADGVLYYIAIHEFQLHFVLLELNKITSGNYKIIETEEFTL